MKYVRFLETRTEPRKDGRTFEKGSVHELVDPSARHWILRGVAEEVNVSVYNAYKKLNGHNLTTDEPVEEEEREEEKVEEPVVDDPVELTKTDGEPPVEVTKTSDDNGNAVGNSSTVAQPNRSGSGQRPQHGQNRGGASSQRGNTGNRR